MVMGKQTQTKLETRLAKLEKENQRLKVKQTEEFNVEFNGICGMYNKRKMWQDGTYQYWKNKIKSRI